MRFTLQGDEQFRAFLKTRPDIAVKALSGALLVEGEQIMTDSKQNYVPVDLGTLRGSGIVDDPETRGTKMSVTLGYGGAAAAYALAVHEHPSGFSPPSWEGKTINWNVPGSGPKYLEKPMLAAAKGLEPRVAGRIKRRLERR